MATIKDIAEKTGLGLATVSSYLNGGHVREQNRIKIEAAIEELHYVVNETARGLKTNKTKMIGAVIPELDSAFCARVLSRIEDELRHFGYGMIVCDCRSDKAREREAMSFLLRRRVDGIFNIPVDGTGKHLSSAVKQGKPVVLLDRKIDLQGVDFVCVDNRDAMRQAVEMLTKQGHCRIGYVTGSQEIFSASERKAGFLEACEHADLRLTDDYIYEGDETMQSGVQGITELMRRCPDMTAVLAGSSQITMGVIIGLNEMGLHQGEDISVIGFDNPQFARACSPKLTIVSQPLDEIGKAAADVMLRRLGVEPDCPEKAGRGSDSEHSGTARHDSDSPECTQSEIWLHAGILPGASVATIAE